MDRISSKLAASEASTQLGSYTAAAAALGIRERQENTRMKEMSYDYERAR
jgi:hypothetical protein